MNNKLFVGNLSYSVTETALQQVFAAFGEVTSCTIAKDRETGRQRGFAFVEMQTQAQAEEAIRGLNGQEVEGRQLSVSVSQPKPRGSGSGGRSRY